MAVRGGAEESAATAVIAEAVEAVCRRSPTSVGNDRKFIPVAALSIDSENTVDNQGQVGSAVVRPERGRTRDSCQRCCFHLVIVSRRVSARD
jgi:hypothetical protein